jgi:hypothetical protein
MKETPKKKYLTIPTFSDFVSMKKGALNGTPDNIKFVGAAQRNKVRPVRPLLSLKVSFIKIRND